MCDAAADAMRLMLISKRIQFSGGVSSGRHSIQDGGLDFIEMKGQEE